MRSFNITTKILLSLSILVLGYFLTIGYGFLMGIDSNSRLKELSITIFPESQLSQSAYSLFEDQINYYKNMVETGDVKLLSNAQTSAAALMNQLESMERMTADAQLLKSIALTRQRCRTFNAAAPALYKEMCKPSEEYTPAIIEEAARLAAQATTIRVDLNRYRNHFTNTLNYELASVGSSLQRQSYMNVLVFLLVTGTSLGITVFMVMRLIRAPLQKTIGAFTSGAMGDFSIRLDESSRDELGRLAHFFNTFMEKLQQYNNDLHAEILNHQRSAQALQKSDELYTRLVNTIPDLIVRTDLDGKILFVNDYALQISGYSREEIEGQNMLMFISPEDRGSVIQNTLLMLENRLGPKEYNLISKDNRTIPLEVNGDVLRNEDGTPFGLVNVCRNISERKRGEHEKAQLQTQLIQAQKMESVGRLAGGVAHDFNNMLSVIIGNAGMALDRIDTSHPLHKTLKDILHAGERSADLTRQLLAFARKQAVTPRELDLNDTVTSILKMLKRLIGEDINLEWIPGQKLWTVMVDPSQIDQILANLAVNARDAIIKDGKIIIETSNMICDETYCTAHPECIPGKYVMLAVSDNGVGMDKEIQANIFEPFFTTKEEGKGTGLGLATVYGIVKQNSGFINVYSEPKQGTTFRIFLPRYGSRNLEASDEQLETYVQGGTETVLIVEDEEAVLKLTKEMLEGLGYHVLTAQKASDAIRIAAEYEGTIDLLITDVVMPDMNGKELSKLISPLKPSLRCLYMSGYTADVIDRQGILDEGVHFIPKPFSLNELAAKVRETLE